MTHLNRRIGLWSLIIYGIGDILGAGIYGLIGRAAGEVGNAVWMAFIASMIAAGLTGLSYASLGSRYPKAGGSSYFSFIAFRKSFIAYVVGLATLASGITSMATGSRAFAGYFVTLVEGIPTALVIIGFCFLIAGTVIRGIRESLWLNIVCTFIELSGLLLIIGVGAKYLGSVDYLNAVTVNNPSGEITFSLILSGAVLTFYSFVGFEDMINVAEEVKNPERNVPLGIITAVLVSSLIYVTVSLVAVSVIPAQELAQSSAPLVDVVRKAAPWFPPILFAGIAMFAVANTALLNFIMGSRLMYGMARQGLLPKVLAKLNPKTRTPHVASLFLLAVMILLAFAGNIATLARATSVLLLICFLVVNVSLIVLKSRPEEPKGRLEVPYIVPALGAIVCAMMLSYSKQEELIVAGSIIGVIIILYFFIKPNAKAVAEMEQEHE